MSWHLPHRLNRVHYAVAITLLGSVGSAVLLPAAQAAIMGKTVITSAQHEPLSASISVSDINAADFAASLASPVIYQQMGLTPTTSMSIRFVPTSATTGQVLINTSQPVLLPFADVVLAIDDNGKRHVIPKTLLMPLSDNIPVRRPNHVLADTKKSNLIMVSDPIFKPLTVRNGAPPSLFAAPHLPPMPQAPLQAQALPKLDTTYTSASHTLPGISVTTASPLKMSQVSDMPDMTARAPKINALNIDSINSNTNNINSTTNSINSTASANQISLPNNKRLAKNNATQNKGTQNSNMPNSGVTNKQVSFLNIQVTRKIQRKNNLDDTEANRPLPLVINAKDNSNSTSTNSTVWEQTNSGYTVQRNDNLWIISQQIAQQNNIDVQTVMNQIKAQNPEAFIAQNSDLLKADATLNLPSYDTVPLQQKLQTAIAAQKQYYLQADSSTTAAVTGNGLSTDILATLHTTLNAARQRTADKAQRLTATSTTLNTYTRILQLQNQKLADPQARLKESFKLD